jgi:N-acetylneuraminic acid mutarotase
MKKVTHLNLAFINKSMNVVPISLLMVIGLLGFNSISSAQTAPWMAKNPLDAARGGIAASTVDGKIYVMGGVSVAGGQALSKLEAYDPETGIWTIKAPMPSGRVAISTCVVDGKIYAIGGAPNWGGVGVSTVEVYDPATNTWSVKADMPTARSNLASCAVNGKIYAIGGMVGQTGYKTVEEYDPETNTWTQKTPMSGERSFFAVCAVDDKIYAMGGFLNPQQVTSTVAVYDPASDSWSDTVAENMPIAKAVFAASVVNGKIYVMGGAQGLASAPLSDVEEYDPVANIWTSKTGMPTARMFLATVALNSRVYAIGGIVSTASVGLTTDLVEEYSPALDIELPSSTRNQHDNTPVVIKLVQNFPNPFHSATMIRYELASDAYVSLTVYDLQGREVDILVNSYLPAGEYQISWKPDKLALGTYILRLTLDTGFSESKKLVLQ